MVAFKDNTNDARNSDSKSQDFKRVLLKLTNEFAEGCAIAKKSELELAAHYLLEKQDHFDPKGNLDLEAIAPMTAHDVLVRTLIADMLLDIADNTPEGGM